MVLVGGEIPRRGFRPGVGGGRRMNGLLGGRQVEASGDLGDLGV